MSVWIKYLDRIGPSGFAGLLVLLLAVLAYDASSFISSWRLEPPGLVNGGLAFGRDFIAFWSASDLALDGQADSIFDLAVIHARQLEIIGAHIDPVAWHYPPTFLLAILPLASLPYLWAFALWSAVPPIGLGFLVRGLAPHWLALPLVALFPGLCECLVNGQNGVISTLLLGGALLALERRPIVAGILFGLLTYKPQLAALAVPALILGGHWRTLAAFAITAASLTGASVMAFGIDTFAAFVANLPFVTRLMETGALPWSRMPTVFAAMRLAGVDIASAQLVQAVVSASAIAVVCWLWWRRVPLPLRGAALAAAIPLTTPYAFDYDLVILVIPLAWLGWEGVTKGWQRGEIALWLVLWTLPAWFWPLAQATDIQLAPLVFAATLAIIWRRARATGAAHTETRLVPALKT